MTWTFGDICTGLASSDLGKGGIQKRSSEHFDVNMTLEIEIEGIFPIWR